MSLKTYISDAEKVLQRIKMKEAQHIKINNDLSSEVITYPQSKIYIPSNTGRLFHSDNSFVKIVMGPYGSGKSTMCIQEIVRRACNMPAWSNGRRKSKWLIVRNTSGELHSTTLPSWLLWFSDLGDIKKRQKPLLTYEHQFNDGDGIIELELIFLALDRDDDIRKIKSFEATGAYINELSEVPQSALSHIKGRVNHRYPSKSSCSEDYWAGIIADTNPPSTSHWIYRDLELGSIPNHRIFYQPPGLNKDENHLWVRNPDADNAINLSGDYYEKLAEGQTEEFIKVYCLGKYGTVGLGKVVYPEFNSDLHAVDDIEAIQGEDLYVGWDGGLTPACIVIQVSARGQVRALKEYVGEDIGLRSFAESIVIPGLQRDFPYCKVGHSFFDPSGAARDTILDEMSCISELNSLGIKTEAARTNDIEPRIASVRYFLNKMIDGKPAFIVSKKGCPVLYAAFVKDYVYKKLAVIGEERYRDKPDKNFASHISDATQYVCLELSSEFITKDKQSKVPIDMFNPVFRWQQ